jgi:WD40 repeat protein
MKTYKPVQPGAGIITADVSSRVSLKATSPDGKLTAEVANSGTVTLCDTTGWTILELGTANGGVRGVAFDREARRLATGYRDGTAPVWDVTSGRQLRTFAAHKGIVD